MTLDELIHEARKKGKTSMKWRLIESYLLEVRDLHNISYGATMKRAHIKTDAEKAGKE